MISPEDYELRLAYIHGKIESLQFALSLLIADLPESRRSWVLSRLEEYSKHMKDLAECQATQAAHDVSSAIFDTCDYIVANVDTEGKGLGSSRGS